MRPDTHEVLDTYSALQRFLNALPPPKRGRRRVLRGQWRHYPHILTMAQRGATNPPSLWHPYAQRLAEFMLGSEEDSRSWLELYDSERLARVVETQATLQHYGAGSPYLDATHSLPIALWFALHKGTSREVEFEVNGPGHTQFSFHTHLISYTKNPEPGALYVFDVEEWAGRPRAHGRMFDIGAISRDGLFSARAKRQSGCLIFSDTEGDLSDQLATAPIRVAWPMSGAPELINASVDLIFPPPSQDPIYRALLDVPLVPDLSVESSPDTPRLIHPLDIPIYEGDRLDEVAEHVGVLSSPLLLPELRARLGGGGRERREKHGSGRHPLFAAVPILFEAPMAAIRSGERWNRGVLLKAMADRTRARLASGSSRGIDLDLRNVFVEFSPLEYGGWSDFEKPVDVFLLRAIWLVRTKSTMEVMAFADSYPAGKGREEIHLGPFALTQEASGALVLTQADGRRPTRELDAFLKQHLFPVLALLRDLNPVEKETAWKVGIVSGPELWTYTPRFGQLAELRAAGATYRGVRYFLPKEPETETPYTGIM
jgi:hypothetical protein